MANYRVDVKTGDVFGAGTDANVRIILHAKGLQTENFLLDKAWKDDFERNSLDQFTVESKTNLPEVERIELWRDATGIFSSWFVDYIEVTNLMTGITSMFPIMRWIRENKRYFINHIDTCLPQDEPFKDLRAIELKYIQQTYQLAVKLPGGPAQVKELPEDEKFSFQYQFDLNYKTKTLADASQVQVMANGVEWKSFDDVQSCYVKPFEIPKGASNFNDDAIFGRQRLAGLNALEIKLCSEIPKKFGVTEAMVHTLLEGKTLEQAIDMKKLFIVDFDILEGAPTKASNFSVPAPVALFYFNDDQQLMPLAIQLFQEKGPRNPVFLPTDPKYTWMLAKMWFNLADAHYHQSLAHLLFTHLMMEGIAVTSKRQLAPSHPLLKLLNPHFLYLMSINYLALGTLVNKDGFIDKYSNGGINTLFFLVKKSLDSWRLDVQGTLPQNLKSRGVFEQSVLTGAYHVRDDGMLLYSAIKSYVEEYVQHYYAIEGSLTADHELQAWGKELVMPRIDGGVGLLGVPNNGFFETIDQLVVTITAVIYTCSVGHATANFQQYDEYGAPFNYPYLLKGTPPTSKAALTENDILGCIGNRVDLLNIMTVTAVLSEKGTQSLGDFEKQWIVDPPALKIVEKFREKLRGIGRTIDERNKGRKFPYDYLHPGAIPNAISI